MRSPSSTHAQAAALPDRRWYAVQSQPKREQLALLHLERQRFAAFCPSVAKVRRGVRGTMAVQAPFFPGYLFVHLDLENERWRSINGTIGVIRLVGFSSSGRPAPLPQGFIERLQQLNSDGELESDDGLTAGDAVRVIGGPFDDLCGVLESASDDDRVTILLSLLRQETRVSLKRGSLIAA
jgi:transcriptional antiterminator RfaH